MLESKVQKIVREKLIQAKFWDGFKIITASVRGIADRVTAKDGITYFIELKKTGGSMRPLQEFKRDQILQHSHSKCQHCGALNQTIKVLTVDDPNEVGEKILSEHMANISIANKS